MKRRDFFAVLGGGIVVLLDDEIYAQETGGPRRGGREPSRWRSARGCTSARPASSRSTPAKWRSARMRAPR